MKLLIRLSILSNFMAFLMIILLGTNLSAQQKIEGGSERSWTGPIFGGATIQALPLEFDGQNLKLRTEGGEMSVPLSRLSEEDQAYVRDLLKNTPKKAGRTLEISRGIVNVKKYQAHIPKASVVEHIHGDGGAVWTPWHFCISQTADEKTLVMSRFSHEKWMMSYHRDAKTYGPIFEMPSKDNTEATYHVISSKDPDKCYVGFGSEEVCEYSISTGRILRRINCKRYPDRLVLNKNCDKLYIAGTPTVWDLKTNKVAQIADYDANCIALDSGDRQMAIGLHDKGTVMLYNARSRKPPQPIQATGKHVWSVRFINDDKWLLVGTSEPATAAIHSLSSGKAICTISGFNAERITDVFCNSDQSLLFVVQSKNPWGGEPTIIFDTQTMLPVCRFDGDYHTENAILTSDEKQLIVPACRTFHIYEIPDRETIDKTIEQMKALN